MGGLVLRSESLGPMIYLTGSLPANRHLFNRLTEHPNIGVILTPRCDYPTKNLTGWPVALDNGCFQTQRWDGHEWADWLASTPHRSPLFATAPDVVADAAATRRRFDKWAHTMAGMPVAYVLQDDETGATVPWDQIAAVFVGGSTEWKLSAAAHRLVDEAKQRGLWAHMGRVNSLRRARVAYEWGCDSVDGTYLAFGPDINTPRLLSWANTIAGWGDQLRLHRASLGARVGAR